MVNGSKASNLLYWQLWKDSGAVGTIADAQQRVFRRLISEISDRVLSTGRIYAPSQHFMKVCEVGVYRVVAHNPPGSGALEIKIPLALSAVGQQIKVREHMPDVRVIYTGTPKLGLNEIDLLGPNGQHLRAIKSDRVMMAEYDQALRHVYQQLLHSHNF